jgi:hypothetical protein
MLVVAFLFMAGTSRPVKAQLEFNPVPFYFPASCYRNWHERVILRYSKIFRGTGKGRHHVTLVLRR